ncbi:uncharacterized protein LOC103524116 [Trichonephila clavipes]|nr:uncharacterized protein LOC103524116 [Trichonephila clavipes]
MIVQFRNDKVSNHGSIPITIDCNVVAFIVFEEGFHQPIKRTKQSVFLDRTPGKDKRKEIVFQWVPSHCGLWGNERADILAKKGTGILQNLHRDLTLHSAKLEIKRIFRESFRLTASRVARDKPWSTLCKKSHGIPSSPRAAAVAKFRLLTGHDCLCAHLFRFNLVTSPICVLCDTGQDMTAAHLDECSALNDLNCIVKRYWRARCLMT